MELAIFFFIAFVAIGAAVLMLLSDNAVHSALALVLNFVCVAFLYLMLNASFLAMVQVAVYAGAIMVLFMFVIMLLGAEKTQPESEKRFPWLAPAALGLTLLILLIAGIGILQADLSAEEPEPLPPLLHVMNVLPDYKAVSIRLNGEPLAEELAFHESSELSEWATGEYEVEVIGISEDGEETVLPSVWLNFVDPAAELDVVETVNTELSDSAALQPSVEEQEPIFELENNMDLALVITTSENGVAIIPVHQDLNAMKRDKTANVQVVHALAGAAPIDVANIVEADRRPVMVAEGIQFGQVSEIHIKRADESLYGIFEAGLIAQAGEDANANQLETIARLEDDEFQANTSTLIVVSPPQKSELPNQEPEVFHLITDNRERFGSPESVGFALFTTYMLPFQVIALLLLVAMVGAIVLTRDQIDPPRKRFQRRLANTGESLTGD